MIIQEKTFAEIAETEDTSKRRVQDVIDLAILAPDILDAIANGEQPEGLTSDYLVKSGVPAVWTDQRALLKKLLASTLPNSQTRTAGIAYRDCGLNLLKFVLAFASLSETQLRNWPKNTQ